MPVKNCYTSPLNYFAAILLGVFLLPLASADFNWTSINTQSECQKEWPCGFIVTYSGATANDYNQPVDIFVLEDSYPIAQIYETRSPAAISYTIPNATNGSILGTFVPAAFMATHRNYTLLFSYNAYETNSSFYLNVYRQPDVVGDVLIWLQGPALFYFIIGLGVVVFLLLIWRVFVGWVF